jgi:hypothetical protein
MTTRLNRRAVLAGAAAVPAISISGLATGAEPDPIFAAIEAHRSAWVHFADNPSKSKVHLTAEDDAETERRLDALDDAACTLSAINPTTIAGVVALLRYVAEHESEGNDFPLLDDDNRAKPWSFFVHNNVADALEDIAAAGVEARS